MKMSYDRYILAVIAIILIIKGAIMAVNEVWNG